MSRDDLRIKETITVEVWRGHRGYYLDAPDESPAPIDLVTNAGRTFLAQRIGANVNSPMAHMAVGSGTTAPALTDTALVHEVDRKALAVNSALTNNVYTAVATWGGSADAVTSIALAEFGVFNSAASGQGTMFARNTMAAVTLADSDLLRITYETNVGSNTIA